MPASASPAFAELGPTLPARFDVYVKAYRLRALAELACELSIAGPGCDVQRALAKLDAMRAELGA